MFEELPYCFSIVTVPFYIPKNNAQKFQFLYILINTYYLFFVFIVIFIYLFTWLCQVLAAAHRIFDLGCDMQDLLVMACGV